MTDKEVLAILALFAGSFPHAAPAKLTADVWIGLLADEPATSALEAAKALCLEPGRKFPPTPGEFIERRRQLVDRPRELPALPPGTEPDTAELRERIADTRAVLAGAATKAAKRLPKEVVDDAKAEVRRRGRDQRGPLVGCPDCRCPGCPYFEAPAEGVTADA